MKIILSFLLLFLTLIAASPAEIYAQLTEESLGYKILETAPGTDAVERVTDYRIIDGDTADLILDRDFEPSIKARFLLIDTPELTGNQPYGQAAKERVIELFDQANLIEVEYEGDTKDRYDRDLVHVWLDGILLQEVLVSEGYAIARYIHDYIPDSKYAETIYVSQDYAKRYGLNVWDDGDSDYLSAAEWADGTTEGQLAVAVPQAEPSQPPAQVEEAPQEVPTEQMVYIAPHSGTKYLYNSGCRGLSRANSIAEIPLSQAQSQGYTLCGWE